MTGSGSESDPFIISDVDDLQAIENDLAAYYELANDIDASATSGWNGGEGFDPIGQVADFTGNFDGKGYTIASLFVNRNAECVGLFCINAGTITNVGLTSCDITGASVGSIAYKNEGTISKSYAAGAVGLGTLGGFAGGFVQWNTGTITNSYTRCSVTGYGICFIAGFVPNNDGGTIDDCYSTGAVVSGFFEGGFDLGDAGITNCFFDTETSGQADGSSTATGKTTAQMKTITTFSDAGWDI